MTSLLHDVLRPYGVEHLNRKLAQTTVSKRLPTHGDGDSDSELVDVVSGTGNVFNGSY